MARLRVLRNGDEIENVDLASLGKPNLVVGRAADADVWIDDRAVGREHAVFHISSHGVSVEKKSKFGKLTVNGVDVEQAVLKSGDMLMLADYQILVEEVEQLSTSGVGTPSGAAVAPEVHSPVSAALEGIAADAEAAHVAAAAPQPVADLQPLADLPPVTPQPQEPGVHEPTLGNILKQSSGMTASDILPPISANIPIEKSITLDLGGSAAGTKLTAMPGAPVESTKLTSISIDHGTASIDLASLAAPAAQGPAITLSVAGPAQDQVTHLTTIETAPLPATSGAIPVTAPAPVSTPDSGSKMLDLPPLEGVAPLPLAGQNEPTAQVPQPPAAEHTAAFPGLVGMTGAQSQAGSTSALNLPPVNSGLAIADPLGSAPGENPALQLTGTGVGQPPESQGGEVTQVSNSHGTNAAEPVHPTSPAIPAATHAPVDILPTPGIHSPQSTDTDATIATAGGKIVGKLIFRAGESSVPEYVIEKPEITIGRGDTCDVVIHDAKASRRHLAVRRIGANFVAVDLGSANGTFVNGVKISQQDLSGDDIIRIGTTEFTFAATNEAYFEQEQNFLPVNSQDIPLDLPGPGADGFSQGGQFPMGAGTREYQIPQGLQRVGMSRGAAPGATGGTGFRNPGSEGLNSIPGISPAKPKKGNVVELFRAAPLKRKIIIGFIVVVSLLWLMQDEDMTKTAPKNRKPAAEMNDKAFNSLPDEKKQFVVNTYQIAMDAFARQDYAKAVYEIDKLLRELPGGYKDAKDTRVFAQNLLNKQLAQEEEKKRREAEERIRNEVATLLATVQQLMNAAKYAEAANTLAEIFEKAPDDPTALRLQTLVEEKLAAQKAAEEARLAREARKKSVLAQVQHARGLNRSKKYFDALDLMTTALTDAAGDEGLLGKVNVVMDESKAGIQELISPHLSAAKDALQGQNYAAARDEYLAVLKIDSTNKEAGDGLSDIRRILKDKSRRIYTEALVLEGVSDFLRARAKFRECLDQAMPDDLYYGRCYRKYRRLELLEAPENSGDEASVAQSSKSSRPLVPPIEPESEMGSLPPDSLPNQIESAIASGPEPEGAPQRLPASNETKKSEPDSSEAKPTAPRSVPGGAE